MITSAKKLAMLVLQSDFYSKPEAKEATDEVLAAIAALGKQSQRSLLPNDVTFDELSWLLDNHPTFHRFVNMLLANAEAAWRQHNQWERKL